VVLSAVAGAPAAHANVPIKVVSLDPYTTTTSYHKTEVEPDTFAHGTTVVTAFQVGRFQNGGASNVGWAASTDGGVHWGKGFLPGITTVATPPGPYDRDTDPSVGYDAKHNVWMIVTLAMTGTTGSAVVVSESSDARHWGLPINVAVADPTNFESFDKNWVACDNDATTPSPFYGNCYVEYDDNGNLDQPHVAVSSDGGQTWTESAVPPGVASGGQPLVQPVTGTVIMPIGPGLTVGGTITSYTSHDGGLTFAGPFTVSPIDQATVQGSLRAPELPSAEIDGLGRVFVVWYDCRFRVNCTSNDIVLSTSLDGQTWTPPVAIPIDSSSSTVDHFLPGIAVDPSTSGNTAHLGVVYYFYPDAACTSSTCQLSVGFISSTDGGVSWSVATQLAGPFTNTWFPLTTQGYMVGDYNSASFISGKAYTVFAAALPSPCQLGSNNCKETMIRPLQGLAPGASIHAARHEVLYQGQAATSGGTLLAHR